METVENGFKPTIRRTRRVKTPTVIQIEGVECGAACLAMILGYHGRFVSLDTLRIECGVSRDGSKATNILKAGRKYGLLSKGWRIESKELKDYRFPVIAFWNFNHFVVVDGYGPSKWYLNDPATGPRTVPADEFDSCFTGVVLTLEPGPDFKKGGVKPGFINALKARATGLGTPLTYAVTAGIMLALVGLVIPTFSKIFIDKYLVMGMKSWVKPLLWAMGFAVLLQILLTWLQQNVLLRLEIKLSLSTSSRFFFSRTETPRRVLRASIRRRNWLTSRTQRPGGANPLRTACHCRIALLHRYLLHPGDAAIRCGSHPGGDSHRVDQSCGPDLRIQKA